MDNRQIKFKLDEAKEFFLNPVDPRHKLYEAMRTIIVDNAKIEDVERNFQYKASTL